MTTRLRPRRDVMTRGRTAESARRSAFSSPARDASSTSRGDIARGCARETARGEEWRETRARSERRVHRLKSRHGRARARVFHRMTRRARGRHSGAARVRGAPCATSPVSTGTRSASGTSPSPRNTSRGTCRGARRPTTTTPRSRLIRDATALVRQLTFTPPNDLPPRQGAPRRARPLEPSRLETRRRRRGARGRSARARLVPRRRRRPTRPQEESTRRPRARRPSRRAPRASSRVTFRRPTGTARQPRRLGARSARAPSRRVVSAPVPVRGDAREADSFINRVVAVFARSRARARSPPRRPPQHRAMGRPRRGDPRPRTPRRPRAHRARPRRVERVTQSRASARVIDARFRPRPVGPRAHGPLPDRPPQSARLPALGPTFVA